MSTRTVLITGASGIIGKQSTRGFLEQGDQVVAVSRDQKSIGLEHERLRLMSIDLLSSNSTVELINQLESKRLRPHTVVFGARNFDSLAIGENGVSSNANILAEFEMNVAVPYQMTMASARMSKTQLKSVIVLSSIYGTKVPKPELYDSFDQAVPIQYGSAKSSQIHLVKELAIRLSKQKFRVNAVAFGGVQGRASQVFEQKYGRIFIEL